MTSNVRTSSGAAVGLTVFAGTMMILAGAFQALQGLAALAKDSLFVVGSEWVFQFDVTTWGWIHLVVGALIAVAGVFLFRGAIWARTVGVALAGISAVLNFLWLPYYPLWAVLIIALDVFVIWALTVHGRDITNEL
jgi:hypothetical protein